MYLNKFMAENNLSSDYGDNADKYISNLSSIHNEQKKQLFISQKGYIGEKRVSEHLNLYNDILVNLENVLFEAENTTVEADNIVVCDRGVFCIETKSYGRSGQTIEVSKDGKWSRYNGNCREEIANVSEQHNRHIGIMQRVVNKELKIRGVETEYVKFEPIYVIANDDIEIRNYSNEIKLLRTSNIYPYISRFQPDFRLSKELQKEIVDIINSKRAELIKYEIKDYRNCFKNQLQSFVNDIEKRKCYMHFEEEYLKAVEKQAELSEVSISYYKYLCLK